jgi:hypothetical protein
MNVAVTQVNQALAELQARKPSIQFTHRAGDANVVRFKLNAIGSVDRFEMVIEADLITRALSLISFGRMDYGCLGAQSSTYDVAAVELDQMTAEFVLSNIVHVIPWDKHPVVPEYSIERHRSPYTGSADLITNDAVYTVDFDCDGIHDICVKTVYDDNGEIVYQDDKCPTPDWAYYSAAPALQGDNH